MTFHRLKDVSLSPADFVCRQARWSGLLAILFTGAFAIVPFLVIPSGVFRYVWVAITIIFPLLATSYFIKSLGSQNWLISINARGITVKFRSYANAHFPVEDEVVVSFDRRELAWIGQKKERLITPGTENERRTEAIRYLQIGLKGVDIDELSRRLIEEQNRKPPVRHGMSSQSNDHPVRLVDESTFQVTWRSSSAWIVPSLKRVLDQLKSFAPIRDIPAVTIDTVTPTKDQAEMESQILELAQRGMTIEAIQLARKRYDYSLVDARTFVESLGRADKPPITSE